MPKVTVEINDNLNDLVQDAINGVKDILKEYVEENDSKELPCLNNDLDYDGQVHELIDGLVPIYTADIDGLWFLHKNKFLEAYESSGIGDNPTENNGMAAIFCYLQDSVNTWYDKEAQNFFEQLTNETLS